MQEIILIFAIFAGLACLIGTFARAVLLPTAKLASVLVVFGPSCNRDCCGPAARLGDLGFRDLLGVALGLDEQRFHPSWCRTGPPAVRLRAYF